MQDRSPRPFLVFPRSGAPADSQPFQTGALAPETGIYRVVHVSHRLPHEVVILKGERFPRCAKCNHAVLFDLVHAAPDLYQHIPYRVYELPVLDDEAKVRRA
jgi:hypothetical protein